MHNIGLGKLLRAHYIHLFLGTRTNINIHTIYIHVTMKLYLRGVIEHDTTKAENPHH